MYTRRKAEKAGTARERSTNAIGLATVAVAGLLCASCAASSLIPGDRTIQPEALGTVAKAPDGLRVVLRHKVSPNGPGSWVRDAPWNEFALLLGNAGSQEITLKQVLLVQAQEDGRATEPVTPISAASGPGAGEVLATTATAASAGLVAGGLYALNTVTSLAVFGGFAALAVAAPIMLVAVPYMLSERADRTAITEELNRLALQLPVTLEPSGHAVGSAFFPVSAGGSHLVVRYEVQGSTRDLVLALTGAPARSPQTEEMRPPMPPETATVEPGREKRGLQVSIVEVILPDGPGSWIQRASWTEYRIRIRNDTESDLEITGIHRVCRGFPPDPIRTDPTQLQEAMRRNYFILRDAASTAKGQPTDFDHSNKVTFSERMDSTTPYGRLKFYNNSGEEAARPVRLRMERTSWRLPAWFAKGAMLEGSAFFPAAAPPCHVQVGYTVPGQSGERVVAPEPGTSIVDAPEKAAPVLVGGFAPDDFPDGQKLGGARKAPARLWMRIDTQGRVVSHFILEPSESPRRYERAAQSLVNRWRFEPGEDARTHEVEVMLALER